MSNDSNSRQLFSFQSPEDFKPLPPNQALNQMLETSGEDLSQALSAASEAAYKWIVGSDQLLWSKNTTEILECAVAQVRTGKLFATMLEVDNFTTRYEAVMNSKSRDDGQGVPYHIEYQFCSDGRNGQKTIWIEDQGRWFAGPDGLPKEAHGTIRKIDARHSRDQQLNFLGNCDPLTGMMNRGRMTEALGEAIAVATRENTKCAFAIAAVNNLSVVNEAYGFEVADEVIVTLGRRLRQVMRTGDGIARYSGGKFGIILNNCDEAELNIALERFLATIRDSVIETQHGPVWAMLSIGAICLPAQTNDANMATSSAEEALHQARKLPSDGFCLYKSSERINSERALNARCAAEIVTCLKEDRFKLAFQPLVCAKTGKVEMHEALLRMEESPSGELIAATHLVPVAERLGLVRLIDRSVMQMIIKTLHNYPDSRLAMNVSATTATDPRWYNQLIEVINANQTIASRLTIEITETVALSNVVSTRRFVESLRKAGCSVAIDDFGAGFTSFRNLRDLPVNMIKLDGSFCHDLKNNKENEYIVRSLIELAGKFKLKTVAEWIETEEDAEAMRSWGIDLIQGHFIGEASIIPPWKMTSAAQFSLVEPVSVEVVQPVQQIEPTVDFQTEFLIAPEQSEVEDVLQMPEPVIQPPPETAHTEEKTSEPELFFDDIDSSILNLRSALNELNIHFAPAAQSESETPSRSAA